MSKTKIRLSWQFPTTILAQIVQVLKHTDVLRRYDLDVEFIEHSYGRPQSIAASTNQMDLMFSGDQPIINLISSGGKFKIISKLHDTRESVIVPINSPVQKIDHFLSKVIASPFDSTAHREVIIHQQNSNLIVGKNVKNINIPILDMYELVRKGSNGKSWNGIDGICVWEPLSSMVEVEKLGRIIEDTPAIGVIAIREDFLYENEDLVVRFLEAILESWAFFAQNRDLVNKWYFDDWDVDCSLEAINEAIKIDPNCYKSSILDIDLNLNDEVMAMLEKNAKWTYDYGFTPNKVEAKDFVDNSYLLKAMENIKKSSLKILDKPLL